ncbi:MAG: GNAT family N-acetyltransferase [Thermodesulfobacteriota bacterium]|nr:GNAT family N-acetyltransferase [Thermodesulfobacteriota bacterium]
MNKKFGDFKIRGWKIEDAPSIAKYANNKKIWLNLRDAFPHPYGLPDAESFIDRAIKEHSKTFFAIATSQEAIGSIGIVIGKDVHRFTAELGYWLAEPYWGKGIMTEAVKVITEYAIQDLGLYRISAEPYSINPSSAKVLEKAGYKFEGTLRSSVIKDGNVIDQHLFSYIGKKSTQPTLSL